MKEIKQFFWTAVAMTSVMTACDKADSDVKDPGTTGPDIEIPEGGDQEFSTNFNDAKDDAIFISEGWGNNAIAGDRQWKGKEHQGNLYLAASAYQGEGSDYVIELTSPAFDLGEAKKKMVSFKLAQAYWSDDTELKVYVVADGKESELTGFAMPNKSSDRYEFISSGDISLDSYSGEVSILFRYSTSSTNSTTWCLDDFLIGQSVDGSDEGNGNGGNGGDDNEGGSDGGYDYGDPNSNDPATIKTYFYNKIKDHKSQSYSSLWDHFEKTDARPDGTVNDIYSNTTKYQFGKDQDNGSNGNFYNREHSVPKSWYGDASPMYTDLYHLYPSDKTANGRRGNYAFGEIQGSASWTNGYCSLGKMNGMTVFEPADEVKGNLARTYFYFATRYEDKTPTSGNGSDMFNGTRYPYFKDWAIEMLLEWNELDPVDAAERKRNEAVAKIQGNRNPFIDDAELAEYIWGDKKGQAYK